MQSIKTLVVQLKYGKRSPKKIPIVKGASTALLGSQIRSQSSKTVMSRPFGYWKQRPYQLAEFTWHETGE